MSTVRSSVIYTLVILALAAVVSAEPAPDNTLSPYFLVDGEPGAERLPLKDTRVEIAVSGVIADVTVTQVYKNEGAIPINARYIFPASTRAAVYGMRMMLGDQVIVAKIKEREQAKQEFEQAKKEGKSASLLEQKRPNVFSMSVANILSGEEVRIELKYTELLVPTDQVYELVFPTVVGPRYSSQPENQAPEESQWVKSPYTHEGILPENEFHLRATISAGLPIQDVQCPSHKTIADWKNPSTVQLALDDSETHQATHDFILRYRLAGEQIASGLMLFEGTDENFFLYMMQPPARVAESDIPPREYIFVVDVSGSMYGFPLDTAKTLLRNLIGQLRPTDFFNVVLFSGGSDIVSPQSLPASSENVQKAIRVLERRQGGGGTELLNALQTAVGIPRPSGISRSIVLVTDGYIEAEKDVFKFIQEHLNEANFFAFGIGSSVNRYLIDGVARAGAGEPFVVTNTVDAEQIAKQFQRYIQTPALTGIRLRWTGIDLYEVSPEQIPDVFADRPVIVYGKWHGPKTGTITVEGLTGSRSYTSQIDLSSVQSDDNNRALRYLWARSELAELSDYGTPDADDEQKITALGLKYNLLTKNTSFIAVRELIVNPQGAAKDVNQPLPLPQGVSDLAVGGGVVGQSEPEMPWLIGMMVLIFAISLLQSRRVKQQAL